MFEPLICGSETIPKIPAKFSDKFPSEKSKKIHRQASAGAQGEEMPSEEQSRTARRVKKPCDTWFQAFLSRERCGQEIARLQLRPWLCNFEAGQQNPKGYQNGWGIKMASILISEN